MKKYRLLAVLAAMSVALAFVLAGCQQLSSGGDSTTDGSNNTNTVKGSTDFSKAAVGDIVLTDGTFVSPGNFTTGMKAAAVIVHAKEVEKPALGVGIHHKSGLAWCAKDAKGHAEISELKIYYCTDGSDGWEKLKAACDDAGQGNDKDLYPAWNFCNTYAATYGLTGDLAKGWYLPTVAELEKIYENKDTIDESLSKAGRNQFGTSYYVSVNSTLD